MGLGPEAILATHVMVVESALLKQEKPPKQQSVGLSFARCSKESEALWHFAENARIHQNLKS